MAEQQQQCDRLLITGTLLNVQVLEAFPLADALDAVFEARQELSSGGAGGCDAKERRELKATLLNLATQGRHQLRAHVVCVATCPK